MTACITPGWSRRQVARARLELAKGRYAASMLALACFVALPPIPFGSTPARAASDFVVTKTADTNDGACSRRDCSLREAILAANAADGSDFVQAPAGTYRLTLGDADDDEGVDGDLDVTDSVVIFGAGARRTIVDASGILGGDRAFDAHGAATHLTLQNLTVTGGDLGAVSTGGGVRAAGRLSLFSVTLRGNKAGAGGGAAIGGPLTMTDSTVSGNTAQSANDGDGGGLLLIDGFSSIVNSTLSGNATARVGGLGAAIALRNGASLSAINATIVGNRTRDDEEGAVAGESNTPATFRDSLLANAPTANCLSFLDARSSGHNLTDDDTCGFALSGDLQQEDPVLGPLRDNGGPTDTHALRRGSPARNAGSPDPVADDQRGVRRPQGAAADIGAFEAKKTRRRR